MGAWGERAFDNDMANDWAYGLEDLDDLSMRSRGSWRTTRSCANSGKRRRRAAGWRRSKICGAA